MYRHETCVGFLLSMAIVIGVVVCAQYHIPATYPAIFWPIATLVLILQLVLFVRFVVWCKNEHLRRQQFLQALYHHQQQELESVS